MELKKTNREQKKEMSSKKEMNEEEIKTEESFSSEAEEKIAAADVKESTDPKKLKELLTAMEDKYLRTAAEFENFRKRSARQFDDVVHSAEVRIFNDLLEIVDNFKRAMENPDNQKDFESFKKGIELIYGQIKEFLNKHKIEPIASIGQKFDPDWHEAIMQVESDKHPEGVIAEEVAQGFKKGEKVVRHSKVGVSTGKKKSG